MSSSDGEKFTLAPVRDEEEENTTVENVDTLSSEEKMNLTLDTLHLNTTVENVNILSSEEQMDQMLDTLHRNTSVENVDILLSSEVQMDLTLDTLHEDGIQHVIKKLAPQDLCNLSQTSTSIHAKTSRPELWQLINVSQRKIEQEGLSKLFIIDKFKLVQRIDLSNMYFTDQELISNLRAVAASSVVELNLEDVEVDKVPTELLAKIASQLKKINLSCSNPTKEQLVAVLCMLETCVPPTAMTRFNYQRYHTLRGLPVDLLTRAYGTLRQMTHVNLEYCQNLREVPVDLLEKALVNLTHINLNDTDLTRQQYLVVVKVCTGSPSIVDLSLHYADLVDVPPHTLGQAAGSLSKIYLGFCDLSRDQWREVLNACVSSPSLVDLCLHGADLADVPHQTLGQAAGSLSKIDMGWGCRLTTDQSISVLDACVASSTLNHVAVSYSNLEEVPAELLSNAVGNLQSVDLRYTSLTTEQLNAVLEKCKSSSSKLTDIDLSGADLREVAPQLMEEALRNLQRMCLLGAKATGEQRIGILNAVLTSNTIVNMYSHFGNVAYYT